MIDVLDIIPAGAINDVIRHKSYINLNVLYNLSYEIRLSILDLMSIYKLQLHDTLY